jgi:hypothetical protein
MVPVAEPTGQEMLEIRVRSVTDGLAPNGRRPWGPDTKPEAASFTDAATDDPPGSPSPSAL